MIKPLIVVAIIVRALLPGATLAAEQIIWDVANWRHPAKDVLAGAGYTLQRVDARTGGQGWVVTVSGPDVRRHWTQELAAALVQAGGGAAVTVVQMCRGEQIATVVNSTVNSADRTRKVRFELRSTATRPLPVDAGARTCWLGDNQILQTAMAAAKQDPRLATRLDHLRQQGGRVFVLIEGEPEALAAAAGAQNAFFTVQLGSHDGVRTERLATLVVQPVTGDVLAEADTGLRRDLATLRPLMYALP